MSWWSVVPGLDKIIDHLLNREERLRRANLESRADRRASDEHLAQQREHAIAAAEALAQDLRRRITENHSEDLETQLNATERALIDLRLDVALGDPRFRFFYVEAMRRLIPRGLRSAGAVAVGDMGTLDPQSQPTEEDLETAILVGRTVEEGGFIPANADEFFLRGNAKFSSQDYVAAIADYSAALACDEHHFEALIARNHAYALIGQTAQALSDIRRAEIVAQVNPDRLFQVGNSFSTLKAYGESLGAYEALLQIQPSNYFALHNCGVALADLGRDEEAVDYYSRAIATRPDEFTYMMRARTLIHLGRFAEAADDIRRAVARNNHPEGPKKMIGNDPSFAPLLSDPQRGPPIVALLASV
jgi:tetratricopeptide (TPR) repeat protein